MNAKSLLAIAAIAAAFSATAQAGEADYASNLPQFQGQRDRAEVRADGVWAAQNRNPEPAGSRVAAPLKSNVTAQAVRADAAQAVRLGQIAHGEAAI
ncbi:MAG: DUF4148 domain-containing protein [Ramlibacter sp.]